MFQVALNLPIDPTHCTLLEPITGDPTVQWSYCDGLLVTDRGVVSFDGDQVGLSGVSDCYELENNLMCTEY